MLRSIEISTIRNCRIVDVRGGEVTELAQVNIRDGFIESIEPDPGTRDAGRSIDAGGLFLAPALIDMHVHLAFDPTLYRIEPDADDATLIDRMVSHLGDSLRGGVTTVRDLGSPDMSGSSVRNLWESSLSGGKVIGARPIFSGPIITSKGGHGAWVGTEITTEGDMRAAIDDRHARGHNWIKLAMSSAARPAELSPELLSYGVDYAHSLGMRAAVHANFSESSIRSAVEARCDTLEHGYLMPESGFDAMLRSNLALCPTLSAINSVLNNAALASKRVGPELPQAVEKSMPMAEQTLRRAFERGIPIVTGTDAGVMGVPYDAIHTEIALLRAWGVDNITAFRAATSTAADVLGQPFGAIEPGRVADFLLLAENPLEDANHLRNFEAVLSNGYLVRESSH